MKSKSLTLCGIAIGAQRDEVEKMFEPPLTVITHEDGQVHTKYSGATVVYDPAGQAKYVFGRRLEACGLTVESGAPASELGRLGLKVHESTVLVPEGAKMLMYETKEGSFQAKADKSGIVEYFWLGHYDPHASPVQSRQILPPE